MAFMYKLYTFSLHYFLVFCISTCIDPCEATSKCNSVFETNPQSKAVNEGERAVSTCTVSNFDNTTDTLIWKVNPSQHHTVISEFYDPLTHQMTSNLTISRVGRKSQVQQCVAFILGSNFIPKTCYSDVANLNVQYFPQGDELVCEPRHPEVMEEGQILKIQCQVPKGNPEVHLTCKSDGDTDATLLESYINGSHKVLKQSLEMVHTLHNRSILCEVTCPAAFPDHKLSYTIGPIIILHKPHLTLTPSSLLIQPDRPNQQQLICEGDGFPEITNLSWSCLPGNVLQGCDSGENSRHILNISLSSNNMCYLKGEDCEVTISCKAINPLGTSRVETKVKILPHFSPGDLKLNSTTNVTLKLVHVRLVGVDVWDASFECTINGNVTVAEGSTVKWQFDNRTILGTEDNDTNIGYQRKYSLAMKSLNFSDIEKRVTCILASRDGPLIMHISHTISELLANAKKALSVATVTTRMTMDDFSKLLHTHENKVINTANQNLISDNKDGYKSTTLLESSGNKHVVLIALAAGGAGIILAGCVFTIIAVVLYKHFHRMSSTMCSHDRKTRKEIIQLDEKYHKEKNTISAVEEEHVYQDLSEINHEYAAKQTMTYPDSVSSCNSYDSYETKNVYTCSLSGNSHDSSGSFNEYSYGSYKSDKSDISIKSLENCREKSNATYGNQSVIERKLTKPTSPQVSKEIWENVTFHEPPPFPSKKTLSGIH